MSEFLGMDLATASDTGFERPWTAMRELENPVPPANRITGMFIADPTLADQVASYAKSQGGKVETFLGFKFITLQDPERTLWKIKLINRLEHQRKRIEAANDTEELAAARKII